MEIVRKKGIKVLAWCPIHYGKDYLYYSIKAVEPVVDEILIIYSSTPQQRSKITNPDTEYELREIAEKASNKVKWVSGNWPSEQGQWDVGRAAAKGFDVVVWFDFDEVWKTQALQDMIEYVYDNPTEQLLCWMRHLWRSFDYICDDAMRQNRVWTSKFKKGSLMYAPVQENCIWHFGYARGIDDVIYKESIHLHKDEWLPNWFEEKFMPFPPPKDVHPTCVDTWHPKKFDKSKLPDIMKDHPYFNLKVIE